MNQRNHPPIVAYLYEGSDTNALAPERKAAVVSQCLERDVPVRRITKAPQAAQSENLVSIVIFDSDESGFMPEGFGESHSLASINLSKANDSWLDDLFEAHALEPRQSWKPWFPVIDKDRCTECGQCLDFCLFDVYQMMDDNTVVVANPSNCKTDCPACSRVCPAEAIVFPKYPRGPINGNELREESVDSPLSPSDVKNLDPEALRAALRMRSQYKKNKFSLPVQENASDCGCNSNEPVNISPASDCDCSCDGECEPERCADCDCDCECKNQNSKPEISLPVMQACCSGDETENSSSEEPCCSPAIVQIGSIKPMEPNS